MSMRIPTFQQFEQQAQNISKQFDQMSTLQQEISSGKRILNSSDDPVVAGQIKSTQDYVNTIQSYANNGVLAQARCKTVESFMQSAINATADIQTILQQVQNGTINANDRNNYANKLQSDLNTLLSFANTQDANGEYIFSGYNTSSPPYTETGGSYQYQGGFDPILLDIGQNTSVTYNEVGYNIFGNIYSGNGKFTTTASSGNTGVASASPGSVSSTTNYVADTYTVSFGQNTSGEMVYQVVGAATGQVIPALPATFPNGAPVYQPGKNGIDINFNGITVNINGAANTGDSFVIQPSTQQNAFNTVQNAITILQNPVTNVGNDKTALAQSAASVIQIMNKFITYQSTLGARSNAIDTQVNSNKQVIDNQTVVLSNLQDADMASVFSELSQKSMALQATQAGYLKLQETLAQLLKL